MGLKSFNYIHHVTFSYFTLWNFNINLKYNKNCDTTNSDSAK